VSYDKALSIDPNYLDALHAKGKSLINIGEIEEAIIYFDRVSAIDPNYIYELK
jgi:tetratricopeptide (TPR) repeat protein